MLVVDQLEMIIKLFKGKSCSRRFSADGVPFSVYLYVMNQPVKTVVSKNAHATVTMFEKW